MTLLDRAEHNERRTVIPNADMPNYRIAVDEWIETGRHRLNDDDAEPGVAEPEEPGDDEPETPESRREAITALGVEVI